MSPDPYVRPISPADGEALRRFHDRLSEESIRRRYHGPHPRLSAREVDYLVGVDGEDHLAWVACTEDGELLGVCRAIRHQPGGPAAEVGIVVADHAQGQGIGRRLVDRLFTEAGEAGIGALDALILSGNQAARHLFQSAAERHGAHCRHVVIDGVLQLRLHLSGARHVCEAA